MIKIMLMLVFLKNNPDNPASMNTVSESSRFVDVCDAVGEAIRHVQSVPVDGYESFNDAMYCGPRVVDAFADFIEHFGSVRHWVQDGHKVDKAKIREKVLANKCILEATSTNVHNNHPSDGVVRTTDIVVRSSKLARRPWRTGLILGGNVVLPKGTPCIHDMAVSIQNGRQITSRPWLRMGERLDRQSPIVSDANGVARVNHTVHELTFFRDTIVRVGAIFLISAGAPFTIEEDNQLPQRLRLVGENE